MYKVTPRLEDIRFLPLHIRKTIKTPAIKAPENFHKEHCVFIENKESCISKIFFLEAFM